MSDPKTKTFYLRVTEVEKRDFDTAASKYGKPTEILRELIVGFTEGRVIIHPPATPRKESLYVPRIEN